MKRKVVQHGPSSLIVSLPNSWVKKTGIQKGDEIDVTEDGLKLTVTTKANPAPKIIELSVKSVDRTGLIYTIRSAYRSGYDEVILSDVPSTLLYGRTKKQVEVKDVLKTELSRLIGFEIIRQTNNSVHIKDLQTVSDKDLPQIVRRICLLLKELAQLTLEQKTDSDAFEDAHDEIQRLTSYVLRILAKIPRFSSEISNNMYRLIGIVDRITDIIKYQMRLIKTQKPDSSLQKILELQKTVIEGAYSILYTYDSSQLAIINDSRYFLNEQSILAKNTPLKSIIATRSVIICELILDLAEVRLGFGKNVHELFLD
jgi:phosphate uptake regulator